VLHRAHSSLPSRMRSSWAFSSAFHRWLASAMLRRRKAGYGAPSCMARLWVLIEGVVRGVGMAGVLSDEPLLSLLRERFDDVGEGTAAMAASAWSVVRVLVSLALRRRARSLCSVEGQPRQRKSVLAMDWEAMESWKM
jgi:hypothetical protein